MRGGLKDLVIHSIRGLTLKNNGRPEDRQGDLQENLYRRSVLNPGYTEKDGKKLVKSW
ncbi:hypothetical protein ES705_25661 [subsurface metagenome]